MQGKTEIKPYIDEEIKSVVLSLQSTNDKLANLIVGDRRRGKDRRKLPILKTTDGVESQIEENKRSLPQME